MKRFVAILILLLPIVVQGATINAASGSRADVNTAIASASAGDTVVVPADTESWSGGVTISGITLQGPGKDHASPCIVTAGLVTVTKHASQNTRLIGFRFTGTDQHLSVDGSASTFYVIRDNHFNVPGGTWGAVSANGGLFVSNTIIATTATSADVFAINLGTSAGATTWLAAQTMGTNDATGLNNIYFENNVFSNILETAFDADNGARIVCRYNTFYDSSLVMHAGGSGTSENDTSLVGHRHVEVYKNTFDRVSNAFALNKWCWWRGGSGVFISNVLEDASSPDGSSYPNKSEVQLGVGCESSGYPIRYQIGQTTDTADATPDAPLLIYSNTGAGSSSGNFIDLRGNDTGGGGHTCGDPETYIQSGRDYATSNTWNWQAYTYPHPLAGDEGGGGGGGNGNRSATVSGTFRAY